MSRVEGETIFEHFFVLHWFALEDAEDGASASAHGGIDGAHVVKRLLDGGNAWMRNEYASLKIINEGRAPRFDRCLDSCDELVLRCLGYNTRIRFLG